MWSERLTPNVSQNIQLTLWMDLRSVRGSQQGLDAPEPLLRGLHPVRLRATWKTLCLDRCSGPNSPAFRRLNGTEVPLLGSWLTEEWQRWAGEIPILVAAFSVFRVPGTAFCLSVGGPDLVRTLGTRHSIRVTDPFTRHSPRSQFQEDRRRPAPCDSISIQRNGPLEIPPLVHLTPNLRIPASSIRMITRDHE